MFLKDYLLPFQELLILVLLYVMDCQAVGHDTQETKFFPGGCFWHVPEHFGTILKDVKAGFEGCQRVLSAFLFDI